MMDECWAVWQAPLEGVWPLGGSGRTGPVGSWCEHAWRGEEKRGEAGDRELQGKVGGLVCRL